MKMTCGKRHVNFLMLCVTFCLSQNLFGVNWSGSVSTDVVNDDINIIGDVTIDGPVHVISTAGNIDVTPDADWMIQAEDSTDDVLYFYATFGNSITFNITNDLAFKGANNGTDFLVSFSGGGEFVFRLDDGQQVCFTSDANTGGTIAVVAMDNSTVRFVRDNQASSDDVEVKVGPRSCFTYISEDETLATGQSTVEFETTNEGNAGNFGCFILRIEDESCWVINGNHLTVSLASDYTLSDIDFATPAGTRASMNLSNGINTALGSLRVINENTFLTQLLVDPFFQGNFAGERYGFILGANGFLGLNDVTYLDYIGTVTNLTKLDNLITPTCLDDDCLTVAQSIKCRNTSAFWVDGNNNPNSLPARIFLTGNSAIYFRSGVDSKGEVNEAGGFIIDPDFKTPGVGELVFDVEGLLEVIGSSANTNGLNILSLEVDKTGCPIFVESPPGAPETFPARTFAQTNGEFNIYNSAAWIINNRMNVFNASIFHTDENHDVFAKDNLGRCDLASEPTYIGGETFQLCTNEGERPTIALYNSIFRFNTSAAFTGVDIRVPNNNDALSSGLFSNNSQFKVYYNGFCIDKGYGRNLIFGTDVGSFACDGGTIISDDAHIDIFQDSEQGTQGAQQLELVVCPNNGCIISGLDPSTIDDPAQCSVHSIYLGNNSNLSIGTNSAVMPPFDLVNCPELFINGDFFSFDTQGGKVGLPDASGTTGVGGIFVDNKGTISIADDKRASFSTMIVKSGSGIIDLPSRQIYFSNTIGITNWMINLAIPSDRVIVNEDECLSDFNLDWGGIEKDCESFFPYDPKNTPTRCECPAVTDANLTALPCVKGIVDQMQILRSRIGDQVNLKVDGGHIRELIFLLGCNPAEAPTGFIVVQNFGRVGLGTTHSTADSLFANMVLGVNGVTICANGDGIVEINEDVIINNTCHIVTGTAFGADGPNRLTFHSQDEKEIRVKNKGVLDLSMFDSENKIIEFDGNLRLVFEPGSQWVVGNGGVVEFKEMTEIRFEDILNPNDLAGTDVNSTDDVRVRITGSAQINMREAANILIDEASLVGIETDPICSLITSITWTLFNQSQFMIGNDSEPGGALQIGDTVAGDGSISFDIVLNGIGTVFQVNRQGFLGFGAGIVNKQSPIANNWVMDSLLNCDHIGITLTEGIWRYNQIFAGDEELATLWVVGPCNDYEFNFNIINSRILGGGNIALLGGDVRSVRRRSLRSLTKDSVVVVQEGQGVDLEGLADEDKVAELQEGAYVCVGDKSVALRCSSKKRMFACPYVPVQTKDIFDENAITLNVVAGSEYSLDSNMYKSLRAMGNVCVRIHPQGSITCADGGISLTNTTDRVMVLDSTVLDSFMVSFCVADSDFEALTAITRIGNPTTIAVDITAGVISANPLIETNIMSSKDMVEDTAAVQPDQGGGKTQQDMFDFMKVKLHSQYNSPKATLAQARIGLPTLGFVAGAFPLATIVRQERFRILGGTSADPIEIQNSLRQGAANLNCDDITGDINIVTAIQGTFRNG